MIHLLHFNPNPVDLSKKRWFVGLVIWVACAAACNFGLTMWIIKTLQIGNGGLENGNLMLLRKGINIKSPLHVGSLEASEIRGVTNKEQFLIDFDTHHGQIKLSSDHGDSMLLADHKLEVSASQFRVNSDAGTEQEKVQFAASPQSISIALNSGRLVNWNAAGHKITNSLSVNSIDGTLDKSIKLESRMKRVSIGAINDITLESRGGSIDILALDSVNLASQEIELTARRVDFQNLPLARSNHWSSTHAFIPLEHDHSPSQQHHGRHHRKTPEQKPGQDMSDRVWQLCSCASGKLFLASGSSTCSASNEICDLSAL